MITEIRELVLDFKSIKRTFYAVTWSFYAKRDKKLPLIDRDADVGPTF